MNPDLDISGSFGLLKPNSTLFINGLKISFMPRRVGAREGERKHEIRTKSQIHTISKYLIDQFKRSTQGENKHLGTTTCPSFFPHPSLPQHSQENTTLGIFISNCSWWEPHTQTHTHPKTFQTVFLPHRPGRLHHLSSDLIRDAVVGTS